MNLKHYLLRLYFAVLSLMMAFSSKASGSAVGISHFYDFDKLSSNLITSICQDKQGYIWISTEYGLNRYDGVRFVSYYADDPISKPLAGNNCRQVLCDGDGRVWTVSYKGVQYYDRLNNNFPTIKLITDERSFPSHLTLMRDGRLLLLTTRNGLFWVDSQKMEAEPWTEANKLHVDSAANCMFEDRLGRLWICSDRTGLTQLDVKAGKYRHFDRTQLFSDGVNAVCEDGKGRIIVLSRSKVLLYEEATNTLREIGHAEGIYLRSLFKTQEGRIIVGTYGNGLLAVDIEGNRLVPFLQQEVEGVQLSNQSVQTYLEDAQHNIWIGCYRRGMAFLSHQQQPFSYLSLESLPQDNGGVLSLLAFDEDGHLIIGQENNGLMSLTSDGQVGTHHFPGQYIISMEKAQPDYLWVGTYSTGAGWAKGANTTLTMIDTLKGKRVRDIAIDKSGTVYLAVFDYGIIAFNKDGSQNDEMKKINEKLHNRFLNKLFVDTQGWLWIGHYNGFDVYNPKTHQLADIRVDSLLHNSHTFAITQTKDGMVWLGTNQGLFGYDKKLRQWQLFDRQYGLCNEIICGIVEDEDGSLWLSTYRGLCHLFRKKGKILNYFTGNGLQAYSYLRGLYGKSHDGTIYFGDNRGITYFNPSKVFGSKFLHELTLTGLFVADKEIITDGEHIKLDYQNNTFTLRFSTMDYREAGNVQYEYRFSDEEEDKWHQLPVGTSDMILSHLRFGKHLLQVRAHDNGVYSPVKQLAIQITPPWYRSWWAYTLYALIATCVIGMVIMNIRHKQLADLNEEKIKFFVDISHELRSPLTLIKSPLEKLLKNTHDPTETRALRNMKRNTDRMLTLINQILSIRKIEKGQMKLHFAETDLGEFVEDICHDFDYQIEARKISLTFTKPEEPVKTWIDRDNFDKVVSNLINNAVKYVQDGGEIKIGLKTTDASQAELTVCDNGAGIDEEQLRKVFDRFYQTSARPAAGQMGYGIGLNLTQKLTSLHGGIITAHNRTDGQGSIFTVLLPLGNKHLPQSQLVDNDYFTHLPEDNIKETAAKHEEAIRKVRKKTNYRVAVVDDDDEMCNFLKTELSESYYVTTYSNGMEALSGITETIPDIIISDIVMPQMDGLTLMKRIKSSSKLSHIPVILLTTKSEHQSLIKGLEEGADAYMDKPFNLEELEVRIAGLIANRILVKANFSGAQGQEDVVKQIELKGINEELMQRIMKVVNERLDDSDFNVEALSDAVGVSRSQLHRRVKEITGISVGEFIRNLRLQQAARLLEKGDTSIAQVTYATGFSNPTHFSAAFKKHFGVSPSEYMNRYNDDTKA